MDRNLNIHLGIRNRLSTGLAQAKTQLQRFANQSRQLIQAIWAPVTVATAVLATIKKVADAFDQMGAKAIKSASDIRAGNMEAHITSVTSAIKEQDEAYKALTATMGRQIAAANEFYSLLEKQEAIQNRLATLARLQAEGQSTESRQAIEDEANAAQRIADAQNKIGAAKQAVQDIDKQLVANARERAEIAEELPELEADFAKAAQASQKAAEELNKYTGKYKSQYQQQQKEAAKAALDAANKVRDSQFKLIESQRKKLKELERAEEDYQAKRKNAAINATNAMAELELERAEQTAKADADRIKSAEDAAEAQKKIDDERAEIAGKLTADRANLEKRLADLTISERQRVLREEVRAAETIRDQARRTAQERIRAILEERRAQQTAQKVETDEARRAQRLEGQQRRGVRLSRRDAEWQAAWREREAARAQVQQAGARVAAAQGELAGIEGAAELQKLTGIETELKEVNKLLADNLRYQ